MKLLKFAGNTILKANLSFSSLSSVIWRLLESASALGGTIALHQERPWQNKYKFKSIITIELKPVVLLSPVFQAYDTHLINLARTLDTVT